MPGRKPRPPRHSPAARMCLGKMLLTLLTPPTRLGVAELVGIGKAKPGSQDSTGPYRPHIDPPSHRASDLKKRQKLASTASTLTNVSSCPTLVVTTQKPWEALLEWEAGCVGASRNVWGLKDGFKSSEVLEAHPHLQHGRQLLQESSKEIRENLNFSSFSKISDRVNWCVKDLGPRTLDLLRWLRWLRWLKEPLPEPPALQRKRRLGPQKTRRHSNILNHNSGPLLSRLCFLLASGKLFLWFFLAASPSAAGHGDHGAARDQGRRCQRQVGALEDEAHLLSEAQKRRRKEERGKRKEATIGKMGCQRG